MSLARIFALCLAFGPEIAYFGAMVRAARISGLLLRLTRPWA
jgi:hypothetical protein